MEQKMSPIQTQTTTVRAMVMKRMISMVMAIEMWSHQEMTRIETVLMMPLRIFVMPIN
jgi:hypothetical protein